MVNWLVFMLSSCSLPVHFCDVQRYTWITTHTVNVISLAIEANEIQPETRCLTQPSHHQLSRHSPQ